MNVEYYNNTVYIARNIPNSYGFYAETTCGGPPSSGPQQITLRNNIFDGASNYSVYVGPGFSSVSEDYNNIGGMQGSAEFAVNGSASKGRHDVTNVNPLYTNPGVRDYQLQPGSPCINAGLPLLKPAFTNMGAY